jgi:pSer/pThr/pTyr-binding forkhead associated (FHA) protein
MAEPIEPATVERVKTRLLGFDSVAIPDTFEKTKPITPTTKTRYPVGWLVVVDGAGRGESFTLLTGMTQIGRGSDQAVQLDFGDEAISRSNHAAIVYDVETHTFLMGHGGKSNVVRLNNKPLISTETLKSGDVIRIGETSLQLVVFSTPEQNWVETPVLEAKDVAGS